MTVGGNRPVGISVTSFVHGGRSFRLGQKFKGAKVVRIEPLPFLFARTKAGFLGKIIEDDASRGLREGDRVEVELVGIQVAGAGRSERTYKDFRVIAPQSQGPAVSAPAPPIVAPPQSQLKPEIEKLLGQELLACGRKLNKEAMSGVNPELRTEIRKWLARAAEEVDLYVAETKIGWTKELVGQYTLYRTLMEQVVKLLKKLGLEEVKITIPQYHERFPGEMQRLPERRPRRT